MKFEEKLILLRKKELLSQEQLAEKLDVTRQTVSKWELGQSKPDMEKLTSMSKLFNISIDILTDDTKDIKSDTKVNETKKEIGEIKPKRKWVLYILIALLVGASAALVVNIDKEVKGVKTKIELKEKQEKEEAQKKIEEEKKAEEERERKYEEEKAKQKLEQFNSHLEFWAGTKTKQSISNALDEIITNNKTNKDLLIEVVYDGKSYGTDSNKIKKIKSSLKDFKGYKIVYYEVSFEYNDSGYINKMIIEK